MGLPSPVMPSSAETVNWQLLTAYVWPFSLMETVENKRRSWLKKTMHDQYGF